jgi:hypothetical protein
MIDTVVLVTEDGIEDLIAPYPSHDLSIAD